MGFFAARREHHRKRPPRCSLLAPADPRVFGCSAPLAGPRLHSRRFHRTAVEGPWANPANSSRSPHQPDLASLSPDLATPRPFRDFVLRCSPNTPRARRHCRFRTAPAEDASLHRPPMRCVQKQVTHPKASVRSSWAKPLRTDRLRSHRSAKRSVAHSHTRCCPGYPTIQRKRSIVWAGAVTTPTIPEGTAWPPAARHPGFRRGASPPSSLPKELEANRASHDHAQPDGASAQPLDRSGALTSFAASIQEPASRRRARRRGSREERMPDAKTSASRSGDLPNQTHAANSGLLATIQAARSHFERVNRRPFEQSSDPRAVGRRANPPPARLEVTSPARVGIPKDAFWPEGLPHEPRSPKRRGSVSSPPTLVP